MKITLDFTKSIDQNASVYYERAKKARRKLEGVHEALSRTAERLQKARAQKEQGHQEGKEAQQQVTRRTKREWYEKF
ncbi:MAG: NFACT family protein, partial [Nanoarchaeota archaeon]